MVLRNNQSEHDNMVLEIVLHLNKHGYADIKADVSGYDTPDKITWKSTGEGHVPDITADKYDIKRIFEIETEDTIDDPHTEDQWQLFATHAKKIGGLFIVVVPEGYKSEVIEQFVILDIECEVIEI